MSEEINHQRRRFLGIAAMTIATTQLNRFGSAIAQSNNAQPKGATPTQPKTAHTDPTAIEHRGPLIARTDLNTTIRRSARVQNNQS